MAIFVRPLEIRLDLDITKENINWIWYISDPAYFSVDLGIDLHIEVGTG